MPGGHDEAREHLVMRLDVGANVVEKLGPGDVLWSEESRRTLVELLRESAAALEARDDTPALVEASGDLVQHLDSYHDVSDRKAWVRALLDYHLPEVRAALARHRGES